MHNLAIALQSIGHQITGSDDIIYDPAKSRLEKHKLLPKEFGWFPEKLTEDLDLIILGMHAKLDNPELKKAKELKIKIHSFPSFVAEFALGPASASNKQRQNMLVFENESSATTISFLTVALIIF